MTKVLFVCMGNICRSPTAEGVFRHMLAQSKVDDEILAASAGTHGYHVGEAPDPRTQWAASARGYDLSRIRARKIVSHDLNYFDLILAMDRKTLDTLQQICPPERLGRLGLFTDYARNHTGADVPDPYYGLGSGFDLVLDMIEDSAAGLLEAIKERKVARV